MITLVIAIPSLVTLLPDLAR